MTAVEVIDVTRDYQVGGQSVQALRGVSFRIQRGEYVSIVGPSGSGKSTLMHLLGGLDRPTAGRLLIDDVDITHMDDNQLALVRNRSIGFVFQSFQLLARASAVDNVALPLLYAGVSRLKRQRQAAEVLERVGMGHRLKHRPQQLSGGEQQRVAIARALVTDPPVLLADEPTGNLDTHRGRDVMDMLAALNTERKVAIVVVTHDHDVAARARRQIYVRDGMIVSDSAPDAPFRVSQTQA